MKFKTKINKVHTYLLRAQYFGEAYFKHSPCFLCYY